jgi:hypothetical protein
MAGGESGATASTCFHSSTESAFWHPACIFCYVGQQTFSFTSSSLFFSYSRSLTETAYSNLASHII